MNEQNAAASGEGVNVPAVAEPENAGETQGVAHPEAAPESAGQSAAENAKYAAARRKAEEQMERLRRQNEQELAEQQRQSDELRQQLNAERERTQDERARIVADEQIRQIAQMDGSIQSVSDLMAMPEYGEFYALVQKGVSMVQAYKLTHYDALMARATAGSARQAARSVASRQHMSALAGGSGTGEYLSVPAEVAAQYRLSKPGITDAEIRRKYRKYKNYQRQ